MITKYNTWTETALKELAAGCYCCLQCSDTNDFKIVSNHSITVLKILTFLPFCYQLQMPHNCSLVYSPFSDRQIWQQCYKSILALADLSCMPIEHLAKSEAVIVYIVICPFNSSVLQNRSMTTEINSPHDKKWSSECKCLHRQFIHVATNWIKGKKSFCFSWTDMLSSRWNMGVIWL
jgi:hypothetical protein